MLKKISKNEWDDLYDNLMSSAICRVPLWDSIECSITWYYLKDGEDAESVLGRSKKVALKFIENVGYYRG